MNKEYYKDKMSYQKKRKGKAFFDYDLRITNYYIRASHTRGSFLFQIEGNDFSMLLVVAEKPSVGMALAKALGVTEKKDGYIEGNGYIVSWCMGHLVSLANADMYDEKFKKWDIADLPIIPEEWQFIIAEDKNKQFGILRQLMGDNRVTEVVNA